MKVFWTNDRIQHFDVNADNLKLVELQIVKLADICSYQHIVIRSILNYWHIISNCQMIKCQKYPRPAGLGDERAN